MMNSRVSVLKVELDDVVLYNEEEECVEEENDIDYNLSNVEDLNQVRVLRVLRYHRVDL